MIPLGYLAPAVDGSGLGFGRGLIPAVLASRDSSGGGSGPAGRPHSQMETSGHDVIPIEPAPGAALRVPTGPVDDEAALVAAILRNDRKATAEFVDRYTDCLYGYVRQRLAPNTDLVEDLVQDVFMAALRGLDRFSGQSALRSWLLGIARHKVEDYYRRRLREMGSPLELDDMALPAPTADAGIEERIDRERLRDKTHRVLAQLPEPYGLVLLWRYWEKRSAREMAEQTGRTEKAIERLLARARTRFRSLWDAD